MSLLKVSRSISPLFTLLSFTSNPFKTFMFDKEKTWCWRWTFCLQTKKDFRSFNHKDGGKHRTSAVLPTRDMNFNSYYLLCTYALPDHIIFCLWMGNAETLFCCPWPVCSAVCKWPRQTLVFFQRGGISISGKDYLSRPLYLVPVS